MLKLENSRNEKVHFAKDEKNPHETLCGMDDRKVIDGFAKAEFRETTRDVNCKLCLKKAEKLTGGK